MKSKKADALMLMISDTLWNEVMHGWLESHRFTLCYAISLVFNIFANARLIDLTWGFCKISISSKTFTPKRNLASLEILLVLPYYWFLWTIAPSCLRLFLASFVPKYAHDLLEYSILQSSIYSCLRIHAIAQRFFLQLYPLILFFYIWDLY